MADVLLVGMDISWVVWEEEQNFLCSMVVIEESVWSMPLGPFMEGMGFALRGVRGAGAILFWGVERGRGRGRGRGMGWGVWMAVWVVGTVVVAAPAPAPVPVPETVKSKGPGRVGGMTNLVPHRTFKSRLVTTNGAPAGRIQGGAGAPLLPPYRLNFDSIVRLVFEKNPSVRAAREEMLASKHGLEEFRANLSRLEPYVELRSDLSDFPSRRGAFGNTVESVVGVKKETFEGAVLSTEVGGSYSRFEFDQATLSGNTVESGAGALFRARVEMPFFGSRKRQDRIIAQAFQESTARKAQLDYLKNYRNLVENALSYYNLTVYYQRLMEAYDRWMIALEELLKDPRLKDADRSRVDSVKSTAESYRNQYGARGQEFLATLQSYLGVPPEESVILEMPEYQLSPFVGQARDTNGLAELIEKARKNNPAFRVLNDAIRNTQLQRQQAVKGKYDVTTFLEGTLFPLGSETFDDRYRGWTVGGGVNVRLNDHRVRNATRLKSDSQVRQFEAEIEAEEISIRRKIVSTTKAIWDNDENRTQLLEAATRKAKEFDQRLANYFAEVINIDQLLSTRSDIASNDANLASNVYNTADREATLILAIGQIYEMVGLKIGGE